MNILVDPLQVLLLQVSDHAAAARGKTRSDFDKSIAIALTRSTKAPTSPTLELDRSPTKSRDRFWMIGLDKNHEVAFYRLFEGMSFSRQYSTDHLAEVFSADPLQKAHLHHVHSTKREKDDLYCSLPWGWV